MKNILFILISFLLIGCSSISKHHIALNDPNGLETIYSPATHRLKIKGLKNEPFMLFFYSTDCGVCDVEIPVLDKLQKEFKGQFKIIGIMGNSKGQKADKQIIKDKKVNFITVSNIDSIRYFSNLVGGIAGTPTIFIFDKDGNIAKKYIGLVPLDVLANELKLLF